MKSGFEAGVNTSSGYELQWGACGFYDSKVITSAATYCFPLSALTDHCFAAVYLDDDSVAMVEQYGEDGKARVVCHTLGTEEATLEDFNDNSDLISSGSAFQQQPNKAVPTCIGGWKDKGWTSACFPNTMA